ncbi:hypothetical protein IMZ48_35715 [Candidatus Bathyarchaeota archaeon]|nr:hypothetical protein [Candidatus Bathyarchaeota archaeon]
MFSFPLHDSKPTMSSEKAAPSEVPAREPAQDTASREDSPAAAPQLTEEEAHEASEDPDKSISGESESAESEGPSSPASDDREQGEISEDPPLPNEAPPGTNPPLPAEPAPDASDDGWDYRWEPAYSNYIFFNRHTGAETFENPRIPTAPQQPAVAPEPPAITGYNPAIHGDYDPNAWYAKPQEDPTAAAAAAAQPDADDGTFDSTALFNRFTGQHQTEGAGRHGDEAKTKRQMNAYFDVDAAANAHDGRSLKAERAGTKPSKNDLKFFKEKRRARKEEKRRAWLRD